MTLTSLTFDDYKVAVETEYLKHREWRIGQSAFNVLWGMRPDLSEQIRATNLDPFHDSNILPEFYAWVKHNWERGDT